jgi:PAS domain S-box-containing protein
MEINPNSIIAVLNILICGPVIVLGWQQRQILATRLFIFLALIVFVSSFFTLLQGHSDDVFTITALERMSHSIWQAFIVIGVLAAKAFVGEGQWITRRRVVLLSIVPAIFAVVLVSPAHIPWIFDYLTVEQHDGFAAISFAYNLSSPIIIMAYVYLSCISIYAARIIWRATRSPKSYVRRQAWLLIAAIGFLLAATLLELYVGSLGYNLYFSGLASTVSIAPLLYSLLRYNFLNLTPLAYDIAVQSMRDAVFVLNSEHSVLEVNAAAENLLGLPRSELLEKTDAQLFAKLTPNLTPLTNETTTISEFAFSRCDGQHYNAVVSPIYDDKGSALGRIIVIRNVTYLKQIEQQTIELARAHERATLLQRLLTDVAHDLRTPLTILKTSSYLMSRNISAMQANIDKAKMRAADVPAALAALDALNEQRLSIESRNEQITANANRLNMLLDSMFEMARLDSAEAIDLEETDVTLVIAQTLETLQPLARQKNVQLQFLPNSPLRPIPLHSNYFSRVIQNLVDNALRYTPDGGSVTLEAKQSAGETCITICDTGTGIAAEDLPHIFERFFRGDKARNVDTGGTGLGLSIVSKVVAAHQGTITIESTPGAGTTFTIRLPCA